MCQNLDNFVLLGGQKTKIARNPQNATHFRNAAKLTSLKQPIVTNKSTTDTNKADGNDVENDDKILKIQRTSSSAPPAVSSEKISESDRASWRKI